VPEPSRVIWQGWEQNEGDRNLKKGKENLSGQGEGGNRRGEERTGGDAFLTGKGGRHPQRGGYCDQEKKTQRVVEKTVSNG